MQNMSDNRWYNTPAFNTEENHKVYNMINNTAITVYILHDIDTYEQRVFYTLAGARAFAKKHIRHGYSIYIAKHGQQRHIESKRVESND